MADNCEINLKKYYSSYVVVKSPKESIHSETTCKSDLNVTLPNRFTVTPKNYDDEIPQNNVSKEYYKRYEHDEIPVKDSKEYNVRVSGSLTNSDLDKLELKVFKNVSQQLQTDDNTVASLESNIKFFQTTVDEIFDHFYTCMKDFDLYKKRYQEILSKSREDSVTYMEDFIKDMIQHIMSSETISNRKTTDLSMQTFTEKDMNVNEISEELYTDSNLTNGSSGVLEAYRNDNYLTDTTPDDNSCSNRRYSISEDTYKTFLLTSAPCLRNKLNNRNPFSEINIKVPNTCDKTGHAVSASNMMSFVNKRKEIERRYIVQQQGDMQDIEIPVKESYAKKNIYLNEDFTRVSTADRQSFMSKICSFLCKRFRKNSFG